MDCTKVSFDGSQFVRLYFISFYFIIQTGQSSMLTGKNQQISKSLENVWQTAWRFTQADVQISADVRIARELNPSHISDSDFLRQCAWAIFGARRPYEVLKSRWPALERAFYHWEVSRVVAESDSVKFQVLKILNSPRKVEGILKIAKWLDKNGWTTIHTQFLDFIKVDEQGNPVISEDLLKWFDQLPWIGQTLAAYIAKDLGVGSIKDDIWMRRLAGWLGYTRDKIGVWKMALDVQVLNNEKINVIDTVLWNWARTQQWLSSY